MLFLRNQREVTVGIAVVPDDVPLGDHALEDVRIAKEYVGRGVAVGGIVLII